MKSRNPGIGIHIEFLTIRMRTNPDDLRLSLLQIITQKLQF